jgi:hypothetical protein
MLDIYSCNHAKKIFEFCASFPTPLAQCLYCLFSNSAALETCHVGVCTILNYYLRSLLSWTDVTAVKNSAK